MRSARIPSVKIGRQIGSVWIGSVGSNQIASKLHDIIPKFDTMACTYCANTREYRILILLTENTLYRHGKIMVLAELNLSIDISYAAIHRVKKQIMKK